MPEAATNEQQQEILRVSLTASGLACPQSICLHWHGALDQVTLVNALELLVSRHGALRMTIGAEAIDGGNNCRGLERPADAGGGATECRVEGREGYEAVMVLHPTMTLPVECRDLSWLNAADAADEWKLILRHELSAPFELYGGPLFRTLLVRQSPIRHVLVFTVHALLAGPSAVKAMMRELTALYRSLCLEHGSVNLERAGESTAADAERCPQTPRPVPTSLKANSSRQPSRATMTSVMPSHTSRCASSSSEIPPETLSFPAARAYCEPQMDLGAALLPPDYPCSSAYTSATHSLLLSAELARNLGWSFGWSWNAGSGNGNPDVRNPDVGSLAVPGAVAAFLLWLHHVTDRTDLRCAVAYPTTSSTQLGMGPAPAPHPNFEVEETLLSVHSLLSPDDTAASFMARLQRSLAQQSLSLQGHGDRSRSRCLGAPLNAKAGELDSAVPRPRAWAQSQLHFEYDEQPLHIPDLEVELVWNARNCAPADTAFYFRIAGDKAYLDCNYNAALFKDETIAGWLAEIDRLIGAMLEQPGVPLSEMLWRSSAERQALLIDLNQTATQYPRDSSIQDLFELQALRTPDAIALVNEEGALTYAELNEKANQLARFLRRYGIGRGERIALVAERCLGSVVGALATLKMGCAYVPVDVSQTGDRVLDVIAHAQPAAILTQAQFSPIFRTQAAPVVLLDEEWAAVATEAMENLALAIAADAPACVLYRHDAAGKSRGVLLPHRSIVRLVHGVDYLDFGAGEVFLQLARATEDAWALEVWGPLLNGGQLAMMPPGWQAPVQIGSAIEHYGATTLWLTAEDLHRIIVGLIGALAPLRQIVTVADAFSSTLLGRLLEEYPRLKLVRGFGPVESGILSCLSTLSASSMEGALTPLSGPAERFGRPMPNTRVYILDERRELVRPGVPGEMHLAGDGLALGYLHAPELTDESFFMHSFSPVLRERLFRTGYLACYREGGRIECLGAIEDQARMQDPAGADKVSAAMIAESDVEEDEAEGLEAVGFFVAD